MTQSISLDKITRNPNQPRQHFDAVALADLAESISINGLKQPITVRPIPETPEGAIYQIVMGERRFRAHCLLRDAGKLNEIEAQVREMDDEEMHVDSILENLQRAEVSPIEEAIAYQRAIDEFGMEATDLAKRLGISQVWRITDRIGLLGLTDDNRKLIEQNIITVTQGYHMGRLSPHGQAKFLELVKSGLVTTNRSSEAAAERILAQEAQSGFDIFDEAQERKASVKKSTKGLELKIDTIGQAVQKLYNDGEVAIPNGIIDEVGAQECLTKLRLLKKSLGQIERAIMKAASEAAIS